MGIKQTGYSTRDHDFSATLYTRRRGDLPGPIITQGIGHRLAAVAGSTIGRAA
jgi:hypothetical protein